MTIKLKRLFVRARDLLLCGFLGAGLAQTARAESSGIVISNYSTLNSAVIQGGTSVFGTNVTVSLSGEGETLHITKNVILDGGSNAATITRSGGAGEIFHIYTNGSLTLLHLTISGGLGAEGGAIYNEPGGTLIVSNCVFSGNSATNSAGAAGAAGVSNGNNNGGDGGDGGSAAGGAIYSRGTLRVFLSVFNNNSVKAGDGGDGGNGVADFVFGGNGGNGGNGGSAEGGAVVCEGPSNLFFGTEFTGNSCSAGSAGSGGGAAAGRFSGRNGSRGTGGGASGGAVLASGPLFMTNCLFSGNTLSGGGTSAYGGGLELSSSATPAYIENTTFYQNSCVGGAVGAVGGGGLASSAALAQLRYCTFATNTLTPGAAGGSDLAQLAGTLKLGGSILSGGGGANPRPNCSGALTDLGYNISSDASAAFTEETSAKNVNPVLDKSLSTPGGTAVGVPGGGTISTLAVLSNSPAIGVIPGIPGISFPATDQVLNPRITPTCIGAYEYHYTNFTTNGATPVVYQEPATKQITNAGQKITFTVDATNASGAHIGYQWQFDGKDLSDGPGLIGAWSNSLTLKNLTTNKEGSYTVIVGSSTLIQDGLTTNAPIFLTVVVPPRILAQPPKTVSALAGSIATLSVKAAGSPPPSYQWVFDGTNQLSGVSNVFGANSNILTINPVLTNNEGEYYVVVSNTNVFTNSVTSATTTLSVADNTEDPTISITLPTANARTTNAAMNGEASDKARVTSVLFWLTNINNGIRTRYAAAPATLTAGAGKSSNWSIPMVPLPGTNILAVQSVDFSSLSSKVVSLAFFYEVPAQLSVTNSGTGNGAVYLTGKTQLAEGARLDIGESYSVTAKPDKFSLFSNWVGGGEVVGESPTLKFIMTSNLVLTANLVSNVFRAAAGTYNGLFYPTNADIPVAEENSGMLKNLVLKDTGACSGTLLFDGKSHPVTANFDVSGRASFTNDELRFDLTLDSSIPRITGTVSNTQWTASLTADFASKTLPSAEYTILFSPSPDASTNSPPGDGYALVTNHSGTVTLSGALADGTSYSQSVPASQSGDVPVYVRLYGDTGLLLGWVNLTNLEAAWPTNELPTNQLVWIKKPSRSTERYTSGFTNILSLQGALWTDPGAKTAAIGMTNGQLVISNASAGLYLDFTNVVVGANNKLTNEGALPANSLTGAIAPKTGLLTLSFGDNDKPKSTTKAYGAVLQNQTNGGGYFLTKTNAGSIILAH